jgi:ribose transport system substrate-binding protein
VTRKKMSGCVTTGVVAALLLGLVGCTSVKDDTKNTSSPGAKSGPITVAMSVGQLDDEFMATLSSYMTKQVGQAGWKMLPVASADRSADKQVTDIQNLLAQNPDVLVIHPTDSAAVVAGIDMANQKGVPVYTVDTPADAGKVVADVRADNVQAGEQAGQLMAAALQKEPCWNSSCKVLELQGRLGSAAGDDRSKGIQSALKQHPQIQLISRPTDWEAQKAADEAQNILTANSDLAGITMASDLMLPGTLSLLQNAGRDAVAGQPGHVVVTSIDGTPYALDAVRSGHLDGSVAQPLTNYVDGLIGIIRATAVDGQQLKEGPAQFAGITGNFVTSAAGLDWQLPAVAVTKQNVDDKTLWANLRLG